MGYVVSDKELTTKLIASRDDLRKHSQAQSGKFLSLPNEILRYIFDIMTDLRHVLSLALSNSHFLRNAEFRKIVRAHV